jgi:hypothetical protein
LAAFRAGIRIASSTAMTAITRSSSIKVKAFRLGTMAILSLYSNHFWKAAFSSAHSTLRCCFVCRVYYAIINGDGASR